jgi:hemerythrin-like domain-containing protein
MTSTDNLRRQHDAALAMSDRLLDLMDSYDGGRDTYAIAMQLNRLVGLLRIHLAQEDVHLYPALAASGDPAVSQLALAYANEMGGQAIELEIFAQHWSCTASIAGAFDEFRKEADALLLAIAARIERENRYLYPLADAAAATQRKAA